MRTRSAWPLAACALAACGELPWGQGGLAPALEDRQALVRIHDATSLEAAGDALAATLRERLGGALTLGATDGAIDWGGASLTLGAVELALPTYPEPAAGLVARVELGASAMPVTVGLGALRCKATLELPHGALAVSLGLTADKLGRVQAVSRGEASWLGPDPSLDISACNTSGEARVPTPAGLAAELARAAEGPLRDALTAATPDALGLDLALGLSTAIGADTLGSGFVRATLRGLEDSLVEHRDGALITHFGLGLEADPHPCMGALALPALDPTPLPPPPAEAGTALSLDALERLVGAAWLGGLACGGGPRQLALLPGAELAHAWPALARMVAADPLTRVGLELWPEATPTLHADPSFSNTLRLESGRVRVDLITTTLGARWRLATLTLELDLRGQLATDPEGFLHFDALDLTTVRLAAEPGLGAPPDTLLTDAVVGPLFDALLELRPIGRLPPALRPTKPLVWRVDEAWAILPWTPPAAPAQ